MPTIGLIYPEPKGTNSTCGNENFAVQSRFINERAVSEPTLKHVFVSAMWRTFDEAGREIDYWSGRRVTTFIPAEPSAIQSYVSAIERQIDLLGPLPVTLVLDTPRRGVPVPVQHQRQAPLRAALRELASRHPNVTLFDPMALMCGRTWCRWNLLSDANHLSRQGSDLLAGELAKYLAPE